MAKKTLHGPAVITKGRNGRPVDTSRNYSRKASKAHAQASNVSPPTNANNTTQRQPAENAYSSHNQQPAYQGSEHASGLDASHASHHNTCHQGGASGQENRFERMRIPQACRCCESSSAAASCDAPFCIGRRSKTRATLLTPCEAPML